jgi:clan AA aspartic protease
MIVGRITGEDLEARVRLELLNKGKTTEVDFLIDTGFSGYMAVPLTIVESLDLEFQDLQRGIMADGRRGFFDTVDLCVIWHDQPIIVRAQVLGEPLIGTRMLKGHSVQANWQHGGEVRLTKN